VIVTFLAPSAPFPVGGVTAIYEFANGLCRRGHEVHIVHVEFLNLFVTDLSDITPWFQFEPDVVHHFTNHRDRIDVPRTDIVVCFDERIPDDGLPVMLVQGHHMLPDELEHRIFLAPCPKVCISRWLVEVVRKAGAADGEAVHVPYGLDQHKYKIVTPVEDRPLQVAMLYHGHPVKGTYFGLKVLEEVKGRLPDLSAVVFGTLDPIDLLPIPSWVTFQKDPPQDVIVNDVYNTSRVFVCPSVEEGFGFTPVEAMLCGCALVTTSNGGSADYAIQGETALVSAPMDVESMADNLESLLVDDAYRMELALRGSEFVRKFDWDISAHQLEEFLERYRANPMVFNRQ
jgi:L-malate glycosyltransferase